MFYLLFCISLTLPFKMLTSDLLRNTYKLKIPHQQTINIVIWTSFKAPNTFANQKHDKLERHERDRSYSLWF